MMNSSQYYTNNHQIITPSPISASYPSEYVRMSLKAIPQTPDLLKKIPIPFGAVIQPLADAVEYPAVNIEHTKNNEIIRCTKCRAYINPFITFVQGGRQWVCNLCDEVNPIPHNYFQSNALNDVDNNTELRGSGEYTHPEIQSLVVDYNAPNSYSDNSRQNFVLRYVFLIDVTFYSVSTGVLSTICETLSQLVHHINAQDFEIAVITFDSSIHLYDLSGPNPEILIQTVVDKYFLPDGKFSVKKSTHTKALQELFRAIPSIYVNTQDTNSCLGSAIKVASNLCKDGGKILIFTSVLPEETSKVDSLGEGCLPNRFDYKSIGKNEQEHSVIKPYKTWYKDVALNLIKQRISVDTFFFGRNFFLDISTISQLSTLTGGQSYYYDEPPPSSSEKICRDIERNLLRNTSWESVFRVRCSHGVQVLSYLGNLFVSGRTFASLASIDADKALGVHLSVPEEKINSPYFYLQSALLYTNSKLQRRVRVITCSLPIIQNSLLHMTQYADSEAILTLIGKINIDKIYSTSIPKVISTIRNSCVELIRTFCKLPHGTRSPLPETLESVPLLALALFKSYALQTTSDISPDARVACINTLQYLPVSKFIQFIYPLLYRIYPLEPHQGLVSGEGYVEMPLALNLSSSSIDHSSAYLMDNGQTISLWFGLQVPPELIYHLFGEGDIQKVVSEKITFREGEDDPNSPLCRICNIIDSIRASKSYYQPLNIYYSGSPNSYKWSNYLIEDQNRKGLASYYEFMKNLQEEALKK